MMIIMMCVVGTGYSMVPRRERIDNINKKTHERIVKNNKEAHELIVKNNKEANDFLRIFPGLTFSEAHNKLQRLSLRAVGYVDVGAGLDKAWTPYTLDSISDAQQKKKIRIDAGGPA